MVRLHFVGLTFTPIPLRSARAQRRGRNDVRAIASLGSLPAAVLLWSEPVLTQDAAATPVPQTEITLPTVEVVGVTPLLGSGVDRDKVPAENQVLTSRDITRDGNADALRALIELVPGVTLGAAAGNPFQPILFYHGFQASPLQGSPQGLAV
jgi:iron complex outermembrane recepter protein